MKRLGKKLPRWIRGLVITLSVVGIISVSGLGWPRGSHPELAAQPIVSRTYQATFQNPKTLPAGQLPEVPWAAILPLIALIIIGTGGWIRYRNR